ncbi:glycosyltransferase involved in cell wall biosynthesis [Salinibacter ruber]|nr:glycosyltransferase involved in cell wall biosynthesis [Salinibacter ruber]
MDALESIHEQEYRPVELIVVDDGSTDQTPKLMEEWASENGRTGEFEVHFEFQPNRGAPSARNLGAIRSDGEFLQFLDSDDKLHPEKIASQVRLLRENPEAGFVYCLGTFFGGEKPGNQLSGFDFNEGGLPAMLQHNLYQTSAALYRRETCREAGPWDEELGGAQEWEYAHRALVACDQKVVFQPKVYNYLRSEDDDTRITEQGNEFLRERLRALGKVKKTLAHSGLVQKSSVARGLALSYLRLALEMHDQRAADSLVQTALRKSQGSAGSLLFFVSSIFLYLHEKTDEGFEYAKRATRAIRRELRRLTSYVT